jgi:uncharacterized membrane protein
MTEAIISFFSEFPPHLATFFMAMVPLGESQLALPVSILHYHLPAWQAFLLSLTGNMVPPTLILLLGNFFHRYAEKNPQWIVSRIWLHQLARAHRKFQGGYEKYGLLALMFFVILPFPLTGAWTAAAAAFAFGFSFKKAWPFIFIGIIGSTLLTLIFSIGLYKIF